MLQLTATLQSFSPKPQLVVVDDLFTIIDPQGLYHRQDPTSFDRLNRVIHYLDDAMSSMESTDPSRPLQLVVTDASSNPSYAPLLLPILPEFYLSVEEAKESIGKFAITWRDFGSQKMSEGSLFAVGNLSSSVIDLYLP
jgi:hypothetical protein